MVARQKKTATLIPLPTKPNLEQLLTFEQAQEVLQVGRDLFYELIKQGMPVVQLGKQERRVIPSSLAEWIKSQEVSADGREETL